MLKNTKSTNISSNGISSGFPELNEKIIQLEEKIKKISAICNELNPYQPVAKEFQLRLREFNILEFEDPFKITNSLLILLEDSIDELHLYKPADPQEIFR